MVMRPGWTLKEMSSVLGVDPRRVGQSVDTALRKIAALWVADPVRTMRALLAAADDLQEGGDRGDSPQTTSFPSKPSTGRNTGLG